LTLSVLIVDDEPLVRAGLRATVEASDDISVAAEADNGERAVHYAQEVRPEVVLMDLRMPVLDGIQATRRITDQRLGRVLVLTTFESDDLVLDAIASGASGYLLKRGRPEDLLQAIREVAAGEAALSPAIARRVIQRLHRIPRFAQTAASNIDELTPREHEILILVAESMTNADIADQLVLSEATVKTHVKRIFAKLGLRDRAQAIVFAYETGLTQPGRPPR